MFRIPNPKPLATSHQFVYATLRYAGQVTSHQTMMPSPAWNKGLGELLHFNQVLESIGGRSVTAVARERVKALWPTTNLEQVNRRYTATAELRTLLEKDSPPPWAIPTRAPSRSTRRRG